MDRIRSIMKMTSCVRKDITGKIRTDFHRILSSGSGSFEFQYVASVQERQEEKENEIKTENQEDDPDSSFQLY